MITVLENQSFLDIAIQEYGSVYAAFDLATENGMSITDELIPGQKLKVAASIYVIKEVADFFKAKRQSIATFNAEKAFEMIANIYELPGGELPYSF